MMQKLEPTIQDYKKFSLGASVIFILVASYFLWKGKDIKLIYGFYGVATVFLLVGLLQPKLVKPIYLGWMKFAYVLGEVNTRIILFLVFVLTILPIGILFRILRKDLLDSKLDKSQESYWIKREKKELDIEGYYKHF
ncbi:MAG: hypothetical protein H7A23_20530 [Leptospiraceae bacterium]|nr:hypothetical protein [Leptospiraceae bacterium]